MSNLTHFRRPIVRHLPALRLVIRFEESGIAIRAYRCRKWKRVTWAQLASLADDTRPVVQACETKDGLKVLRSLGAIVPNEEIEGAAKQ